MMKRMLLLLAAGALAVPVISATRPVVAAESQSAPATTAPSDLAPSDEAPAMEQRRRVRSYRSRSYRPHTTRRTYRSSSRRYYRPAYRSYYYAPPVVYTAPTVFVQPAPIYVEQPMVVEEVAYASPTPVIYEAPGEVMIEEEEAFSTSIIVAFTGINESDTSLSYATLEGSNLLGINAALRFDLDDHWMIETGIGFMGSEAQSGIKQVALPLSVSAIAHLFPGSIVDPYGIAGLNVIFSEYDDPSYAEVEQYTQFGGHLGFGAEINFGRFLVSADLRFLFFNARPERDLYGTDLSAQQPGGVSVRDDGSIDAPTISTTTTENGRDTMSTALQFQIGAGWRF